MKKLIVLLFVIVQGVGYGQTPKKSATPLQKTKSSNKKGNTLKPYAGIPFTKLSRVSLGAGYGLTFYTGDVVMDGTYPAYGLWGKYSFSHIFGLRLQGLHGKISGSPISIKDKVANAWFVNVTSIISAQFIMQVGGLDFKKSNPKDNFYLGIGGGLLINRSRRDYLNNLGYQDVRDVTEFTMPLTLGYKRKLNNNFDIGFEANFSINITDKIDMYPAGKLPDLHGYGIATLAYNITTRNRTQHMDWFNPVDKIYKKIDDTKKETLELTKQDDDGDGVPNFMDDEQETKKGYKVTNRGVILDSDEDGIPDTDDKDPYGFSQAISIYFPDFAASKKTESQIFEINDSLPKTEFISISASGGGLPLITFAPNGFTIHVEQYELLQQISRIMMIDSSANLVIIGHADNNREDITQLTLSEKRAIEVKRKLAKIYEIDEDRMLVFSERDPYIKKYNLGSEGLNRKVEFRIIRPKAKTTSSKNN